MTDQELLQLLEEKMPEELTLEEIEHLRRRLAESAELRESLASQVHFESYLQAALARLKHSPTEIAARARLQQRRPGDFTRALILLFIVVPTIAILGVLALNGLGPRQVAKKDVVKEQEQGKNEPTPEEEKKKDPEQPSDKTGEESQQPEAAKINDPEKPGKQSTATTKAPAKPAAPEPPPWQAVAESMAEQPAFTEVAFQSFDLKKEVVRREQLQPWFESAPGQNYRLHEVDTQYGRCAALEGLARLKSPWLDDSLLRMALENYNKLQIHLFHGNTGVTLVYHQDNSYCWAAYTTTRKPKAARPDLLSLTSTDDARNFRTEVRYGGPLDLRFHRGEDGQGHVVLSRGDIVLVSAPLPGLPDDVYFEGRATFYGLRFLRTRDALALTPPRKLAFETDRPADLPWTSSQPEVTKPKLNDDGSLTFTADNTPKHVWCWTPLVQEKLPKQSLHQVVLKLTDITPGVAVYLGRDGGQPGECVRFVTNRRTKRLVAALRHVDKDYELDLGTHAEQVEAAADPKSCWLRLQFGCGTYRWWMSSDGRNWAQPAYMRESLPGKIDSFGLFLVGTRPKTQATLRRIELRELTGLTTLATADSLDKAVVPKDATNFDQWREQIGNVKPSEISEDEWRRACAIKALAQGTTKEIGHPLVELLLDDAAARKLPLTAQLAAHEDALAIVSDIKDNSSLKVGLLSRLAKLGQRAFEEQGLPPFSTVRHVYQTTPIHTVNRPGGPPLAPLEPAIRTELMQRAYQQQPAELLELCEQLRFFHLEENVPLIVWADAFARRETSMRAVSAPANAIMRDSWRPLLVEDLSKEAYNLTSELQAVLESEAWEDAARIITSIDPEAAPGVSPYVKDKQLLTSLPVAVQLLMKDYPALQGALGDRFGPLAKLRIGQAIAAGDSSAVELATVQFGATAESAEALRWLGDRALSNGWFEEAIVNYQRATDRHPLLANELAPRIRLAAAMLGRDVGAPVTSVVQFNDLKMDAAQFEALVAEMRGRGTSAALAAVTPIIPGSPLTVPPPTEFATHNRSRLDGPTGDKPQEEVNRKTNQFAVPWPDKQLSVTVAGDLAYVANRFQLAAYNLTNGQRQWQNEVPPGQMQKAQDWALIAMKPLVLRDHILVRQLYGKSPQIVCMNKADGKRVWSTERGDREFFISDPVYLHGQIVAISVTLQDQQDGQGHLRWNVLDPATGELQSQRDLVRLRSTWGARAVCEVLPLEHHLLVTLGGVTLALDARGQVAWVRKQVTMPSDEDPRWVLQTFHRPLVADGRVILSQPGTRSILALDPATGLKHWETLIPDVQGIWGIAGSSNGKLVICQSESGIQALDFVTGKRVWTTAMTDLQPHALVDDQQILVARKGIKADNKQPVIELVWLEPATGKEKATTQLAALTDGTPRLGPLVPYKDRLFTFFGKGQHDPNRDVVELVPSGAIKN